MTDLPRQAGSLTHSRIILAGVRRILRWADAHRAATGHWPTNLSGPVVGVPGEKWVNLDAASRLGRRGLPSGTSLTRLIAEHRDSAELPPAAKPPRDGSNAPPDFSPGVILVARGSTS